MAVLANRIPGPIALNKFRVTLSKVINEVIPTLRKLFVMENNGK